MERVIIKELERTLLRTRERMLIYSKDELKQISDLVASATLAIALESYSRELEAMKTKQPELV
jgi:hypothetical protein